MAQSVTINGVTYPNAPAINVPKSSGSGNATFYETSDADITGADVLSGKTGYGASGQVSGSMADNGSVSGSISTKAGTVVVAAGYTSGGTVGIDSTEQSKLIASNIKAGVTILGVEGSLSSPTITQDNVTHVLTIA